MQFFSKSNFLTISFEANQANLLLIEKNKKPAKSVNLINCGILDLENINLDSKVWLKNFVDKLKNYLLENKIITKKIYLVLPEKFVFKYAFEFEKSIAKQTMLKTLEEKIGKFLNLDKTQFNLDFLETHTNSKILLETFSVKKSLVEQIKQTLAQANLKLKVLDVELFCSQRLLSAIAFSNSIANSFAFSNLNNTKNRRNIENTKNIKNIENLQNIQNLQNLQNSQTKKILWLHLDKFSQVSIFINNKLSAKKSIDLDLLNSNSVLQNLLIWINSQDDLTDFLRANNANSSPSQKIVFLTGALVDSKKLTQILQNEFDDKLKIVAFEIGKIQNLLDKLTSAKQTKLLHSMPLNIGMALRDEFL